MSVTKFTYFKYLGIALLCFLIFLLIPKNKLSESKIRDFEEIKKSGVLRIATEYNSIGYFSDQDTVAGFHYDLINDFAHRMGLKTEIVPIMSYEQRVEGLKNGLYDIIATNIPVTSTTNSSYLLTTPLIRSKQVLIQRKPISDDDTLFIRSQIELAGCTLHIVKESPTIMRIHNLSNEVGDTIYINEIDKYGDEQLISLVAHGDIDYAVCNEVIAKAVIDDFPQIDIKTDIGLNQFYAWAVNNESPILLDSLNRWLDEYTKNNKLQKLYQKYLPK